MGLNAVEFAAAQGAGHRYIRRMMGLIVPPFSAILIKPLTDFSARPLWVQNGATLT